MEALHHGLVVFPNLATLFPSKAITSASKELCRPRVTAMTWDWRLALRIELGATTHAKIA